MKDLSLSVPVLILTLLEASVEEDKTVGAKCGDALAEPLPRVS
jgi:hypothetical protein